MALVDLHCWKSGFCWFLLKNDEFCSYRQLIYHSCWVLVLEIIRAVLKQTFPCMRVALFLRKGLSVISNGYPKWSITLAGQTPMYLEVCNLQSSYSEYSLSVVFLSKISYSIILHMCRLIFSQSLKGPLISGALSLIYPLSFISCFPIAVVLGAPYHNYGFPLPREVTYFSLCSPSFWHGSESSGGHLGECDTHLIYFSSLEDKTMVLCVVQDVKKKSCII